MKRNTACGNHGIALLAAIGFLALVGVGVTVGVRLVADEAALQGQDRRAREAFFAAEAGLAEGREAARLLLGDNAFYTPVLGALGAAVSEAGFPDPLASPWYELIPATPYLLASGGAAIDASSDDDLARNGMSSAEDLGRYPEQANVSYRVFLHDDVDGDGDLAADVNRRVWLVSVGEVANSSGRPSRAIVRALVTGTATSPVASGYFSQKGGSAEKASSNVVDTGGANLGNWGDF